tara:strand:+ start:60 stop:383 length:324 start_codon:yes stop_codon:yes gene_type:complete
MINLFIREPAFSNLLNGNKKYELRLLKGIFNNLNIGDEIILCNNKNRVTKTIEDIKLYNNFTELLTNLGVNKCLVNISNIKCAQKYIETIYSEKMQQKYSCLALKFN